MSPGKFEGNAAYVEYFWDAVLNGDALEEVESEGDLISVVEIDREDIDQFPDLEGMALIGLWGDNNGFVNNIIWTDRAEYEAWVNQFGDSEEIPGDDDGDGDSDDE